MLKRLGCILALTALVATILAPSTALAKGRPSIVYTAVGDSIAVGSGASDPALGYVSLFASQLARGKRSVTLHRACYDGMTSGMLLGHLTNPAAPFYAEFNGAVASAQVISVSIGGNDLLQSVAGLTPAYLETLSPEQRAALAGQLSAELNGHISEFAANWPAVVARIRALNPAATILVNTVYNPFKAGDGLFELVDPYIQGVNAIIVSGAGSGGYQVVDVYGKFSAYDNGRKPLVWGLDGVVPLHPTDRGYKLICNLLKDAYGM